MNLDFWKDIVIFFKFFIVFVNGLLFVIFESDGFSIGFLLLTNINLNIFEGVTFGLIIFFIIFGGLGFRLLNFVF